VRRDLDVRLIDNADGAFAGSRAKGIQPRTQEVFEDLGVLDEPILVVLDGTVVAGTTAAD